jgi:hypothetical protein
MFKSSQMDKLEEIWASPVQWRTLAKFKDRAHRSGVTDDKLIKEFWESKVVHDVVKIPKPNYVPIYAKQGHAYQFDTLDQHAGPYFLIVVNINTRRAWAFPMPDKGTASVLAALKKFWKQTKSPGMQAKIMTSDQDSAYLTQPIIDAMQKKKIRWTTTTDNDHQALGIINRLMRTLRFMNKDNKHIDVEDMKERITEYNSSVHSAIGEAPFKMTKKKEAEYIEKKNEQVKTIPDYDFKSGDHVRIILDRKQFEKARTKVSDEAYIVDQKVGRSYIIRGRDDSVDTVPGFKLVHCDSRIPLGDILKSNKRGTVDKLISYQPEKGKTGDSYKVKFEGDSHIQKVSTLKLREGHPTN